MVAGLDDIIAPVSDPLPVSIRSGLSSLFVHHPPPFLLIFWCADPDVLGDLDAFLLSLIPVGDPVFQHTDKRADDMPARARAAITGHLADHPDSRPVAGTRSLAG